MYAITPTLQRSAWLVSVGTRAFINVRYAPQHNIRTIYRKGIDNGTYSFPLELLAPLCKSKCGQNVSICHLYRIIISVPCRYVPFRLHPSVSCPLPGTSWTIQSQSVNEMVSDMTTEGTNHCSLAVACLTHTSFTSA